VASQRCPKCNRIDATAKVSAIVKSGTKYSTSYDTKEDASYRENGIEWSFNLDSVTTTTQTILARQLNFPDKAGVAMACGWTFFILLSLSDALFSWIRADSVRTGNSTSTADLEVIIGVLTVGTVIAMMVALFTTPIHIAGRARAHLLWEQLYYCFRDDIVYSPYDPAKTGPPSRMRQIIGY